MAWKVYKCDICGRVLPTLEDGDAPICCNQPMKLLVAGTTDAAVEKHVPQVTIDGNKVSVVVGSVEHPMLDAHYITFIAINTKKGGQIVNLAPGEKPAADLPLKMETSLYPLSSTVTFMDCGKANKKQSHGS